MALARDRKLSVLTPVIRAAAGVLGLGVFAAGVAAVFVTDNGTGAAALLVIGAAFMVIAVLGDRIQSVELDGVNLTIRDLAQETYARSSTRLRHTLTLEHAPAPHPDR
jgi:hypothetical protein